MTELATPRHGSTGHPGHSGGHPGAAGGHPGDHPGGHPGHGPLVREIKHDLNDKPFLVIWEVTRACALVCQHCRAEAQHRAAPGQLTNAEGHELIDQLTSYERPYPMLVLTGGDCFERPDLVDLIEYAVGKGLHVSISPSVTPLFTRERVKAVQDAGVSVMSMSLDGGSAETHDAFRGFPGTFDHTIEACHMLNELGMRFQLNTVFTAKNIHEAPQMLKNAIDLGAFMFYTFMLVPTGRGQHLDMLTPHEREDVLHWLHDNSTRIAIKTTEAPQYRRIAFQREAVRQGKAAPAKHGELYHWLTKETHELLGENIEEPRPPRTPLAINSGSGFAFIDHTGDVYPSGFLPIHCGSIKDTPFPQIYRESEVFRALRNPSGFEGKCGACEFNHFCGGSRSTAYAMTGNYLASDPSCAHIPAGYTGELPEGIER
ncbi:MAG: TIGR04053 family radical SAM/SPASM domain-containing protein [Cutibacterium granulosum]|uniref:TIGR04053 family radical SAM/SPASM domain-containing protein n=1 Tax=Cutibacterium granulosum TaxID=33011 RepID=UPI0029130003|nr:TIGR04053 family radical SAM/SPASM domain-containing protein [Cutibacterium granulosum]MDU3821086.1 TIGR04053 family radical SAM/SPASM domain-containing protein [Cutibacterium granulosum]